MRKGLMILAVVWLGSVGASAATTSAIVTKIADRLVNTQVVSGNKGFWTDDTLFTGTIVSGLVDAYQLTCTAKYKATAERGGNYILSLYVLNECNLYGDEAYAFMRLSQIQADTCSNLYRTKLAGFYECVRGQPGGTQGYIDQFATGTIITTAVYYLAYHTVAAYYVDATDKLIWRNSLIHYLAHVDDDSGRQNVSVTALGAAIWALAKTGPLDSTPVKIYGLGSPNWNGILLEDLPFILQMHRCVDPSEQYTGNFFWRFDHQYGLGYTEDDVYGILGLAQSQNLKPGLYDFQEDIDVVWEQIQTAVDLTSNPATQGFVYAHIDPLLLPPNRAYYAGEMLMGLAAAAFGGDIDLDDDVDTADLAQFVNDWLYSSGGGCAYACKKTDFNHDGKVNLLDFAILSEYWLIDR
jgi:hypothetical protein